MEFKHIKNSNLSSNSRVCFKFPNSNKLLVSDGIFDLDTNLYTQKIKNVNIQCSIQFDIIDDKISILNKNLVDRFILNRYFIIENYGTYNYSLIIVDVISEKILYNDSYPRTEYYPSHGTLNTKMWVFIKLGYSGGVFLIINDGKITIRNKINMDEFKYVAPENCLQVNINNKTGFFNLETLQFQELPSDISHAMYKINDTQFCFATNNKTVKICEICKIIPKIESSKSGSTQTCSICLNLNNGEKYAFVPCGHTNVCSNCLKDGGNIKICPTCRANITTKIKLVF